MTQYLSSVVLIPILMVRIGILGRGFIAGVHARRYADMDDVEVAAVASPSRPDEFVEQYAPGASVYADAEELYDDVNVDAVDVCTPTDTHRPLIEDAAERGIDVLCEKPIERTIGDAKAIADAVDDAGITFLPAHVLRFFPEYVTARRQVLDGDVGSLGTVRALRQSPFAEKNTWFLDEERSGGVLLDLAIHDFDFFRWTVGEIDRVFTQRQKWGQNEYALVTLRFEDGTVGHVDARWPHQPDLPFVTRFEIAGDDGLIEFDSEEVEPIRVFSAGEEAAPGQDPVDMPLTKDPYRLELEHFVDCVRNGTEPEITMEDGIEAMRISLAALESGETGKPVTVSEVGR